MRNGKLANDEGEAEMLFKFPKTDSRVIDFSQNRRKAEHRKNKFYFVISRRRNVVVLSVS